MKTKTGRDRRAERIEGTCKGTKEERKEDTVKEKKGEGGHGQKRIEQRQERAKDRELQYRVAREREIDEER